MACEQAMKLRRRTVMLGVSATLLSLRAQAAVPQQSAVYILELSDVSTKVGEQAVLVARLRLRDGYRFLHSYNNRVGQLSAIDDAVEFGRKAFPGADEDGVMVFAIDVRPTRPGTHPINGVLRFGYAQGTDEMAMISVPIIANVVGET